jgi:tetratricopeptide (TPR) repeat protein
MRLITYLIFSSFTLFGQTSEVTMTEGLGLEEEFKPAEALKKYEIVLKQNPDHIQALIRASRMMCNAAGRMVDKIEKGEKLAQAEVLAKRAVQLGPQIADAHFSLLVVLGLQSEIAPSPREKLKDAKLIHEEAQKIIEINPGYALAYYVLGKWHYELSSLTWVERVACDLFYGGLPQGVSMKESIKNFDKAIELDPDQIIILYGYALTLHYQGKDEDAKRVLQKAINLPLRDVDDPARKEKCKALLKKING